MVYDVVMSDGSVHVEYGRILRTVPTFSDGCNDESVRPDLHAMLKAARVLLDVVENACLTLDGQMVPR
jgi:hypothetical protein